MRYRLIAMDLDGTLNNDAKQIDPATRAALLRAQERGVVLALASARPLPGLYRDRDRLEMDRRGGLLMACNGGCIVDAASGAVLHYGGMGLDEARNALRLLERLPVTPILDDGARFYVTDRSGYKVDYECRNNRMDCVEVDNLADFIHFAPLKILMSVRPEALKDTQRRIAEALPESLRVVQTADFYLEIIPASVDKGKALLDACRLAGVDPGEAVAFGDAENDIPMLRAAGLGVAMGNANAEVRSAADFVTRSNNADGIAWALQRYGIVS